MKPKEAEQAKLGNIDDKFDINLVNETVERTTDHIASELQRQLGFFWNASATDKHIEKIYLCGGAAQSKGLIEELAQKTSTSCVILDAFRGIECPSAFDVDYLKEVGPSMCVSAGLAIRRLGDKQNQAE